MAVNYDIVYYQNVHYNDTDQPVDSFKLTSFESDLLDKQNMYNVAINKFKISDMSTIPLGFNVPFNEWEVGLKMNNNSTKQMVTQIGSDANPQNILYSIDGAGNIILNTYTSTGELTQIQSVTLSNNPQNLLFVVADSNENIYVVNSTNLYVYDGTGELLTSQAFTSIGYLAMTKQDKILVTDAGAGQILVYTYSNNVLNLNNTISQNHAGTAFSTLNLLSCVHDGTQGLITYNLNSFSLLDSGFNVIMDNLNNSNFTNLIASEVISEKGLGYVIDNKPQAPTDGFYLVNINSSTNNIELYNITEVQTHLLKSFAPNNSTSTQVYPNRAFFDNDHQQFWATDNQNIYVYDINGAIIDDKNVTDITDSFYAKNNVLLTACNLNSQSIVLGFVLTNNKIVQVSGDIRTKLDGTPLPRIDTVSSDGQAIIVSYNQPQVGTTIYSAETYLPTQDIARTQQQGEGRYDQTFIDTRNNMYYINQNMRTTQLYANTNNLTYSGINLCYVNGAGAVGSPIITTNENITSLSCTNIYTFAGLNAHDGGINNNTQVVQQKIENITPTSAFVNYSTGTQPYYITSITSLDGSQIINIGTAFTNNNPTQGCDIVTQETGNNWTSVFHINEDFGLYTPPQIIVNPIDNTIWLISPMFVSSGLMKSNIAPTFSISSPFLDFTNVTFSNVKVSSGYGNGITGLAFDVYPDMNDIYATISDNGSGNIYKGYYNAVSNEIYLNVFIRGNSTTKFYGYLMIPQQNAYTPDGDSENEMGNLYLNRPHQPQYNNNLYNTRVLGFCEDYHRNLIMIGTYQNTLTVYDTQFNQQTVYTVSNLSYFSISNINASSQVYTITLSTLQPATHIELFDTYLLAIARNNANNLILVQTSTTNQLLFLDDVQLTQIASIPYSNQTSLYSTSTILGQGDASMLVYSYDDYIERVNDAFSVCLQRLKQKDASITITDAPSFSYNKGTGLLTLSYDPIFYNQLASYSIYLGKQLYQYFKFNKTIPQTVELNEMYKVVLNNNSGTITQNSLSMYQLNQLDKIVITTNLMIYADVSTDSLKSLKVFSEFDIDTSSPSTMYNEGCLLYSAVLLRNYVMLSPSALRSVQYEFYYQFKNGIQYKFMISPNNNVSIKLQFTRAY